MTQKSMRAIWRNDAWVKPFIARYKKTLAASLFLGVATLVFACALMFTSGYLISLSAEMPADGMFALFSIIGFVQIFGIGKPFLGYFERLKSHDWVFRITSELRRRLYLSYEANAMFFGVVNKAGDALGLLSEDIAHIQNLYIRSVFPQVIACILWLILSVALGFFSVWFAACMFLLMGILVCVVPLVSVQVNGARSLRAKALTSQLYASAYDSVSGLADWTFSGRREEFVDAIATISGKRQNESARINSFSRKRDFAVQLIFLLAAVAMTVWAGMHFAEATQAPAKMAFVNRPADWTAAFVLGLFPLVEAITPLSAGATQAITHMNSVERMNELNKPSTVEEKACAEPTAPLSICFNGVSFTYGDKAILEGLTLCIQPGEKVAILGPSGTGKSTALSLLRGDLDPCEGSIAIGGCAPREIGDAISNYVGLIGQHTYLFNRTLLYNLRLGNPDATKEQAEQALAAVGLTPLLERLPKGLSTIVDEAGMRFSGGERHRIALARILLSDTPIVLLDEPCASLDPATELALMTTMFETLKDRTVVMVTHHLAGIEHFDRVVFLRDGKVHLEGSPAELERTSEYFRTLINFDRGL